MVKKLSSIVLIMMIILCGLNIQAAVAGTLTLSTSSAAPGDVVTVSGISAQDTWVAVKVLDRSGSIVFYDNIKSDMTGAYSCSFKIPASADGSLKVVAGYGSNVASASLNITQPRSNNDENGGNDDVTPPFEKTIAVTETSCDLFSGSMGDISASADMENAFSNSVEMKVTNTQEDKASFGFGAGYEVYPFDISLYIKGTNQKTQPADGYAVTIALPVPENLLDQKEMLSVVHRSDSGVVTTLSARLKQTNGIWYLVFEATEFSPYAIVIRSAGSYDEAAGVPYYLDAKGSKVFIGLAANGRYIAPKGVTVSVMQNAKSFTDVSGHWAAGYIGFVTEREIFFGIGSNTFSPDMGMTRAMFATVIGRLFERSYGEIKALDTHVFTDCYYGEYYGKYIDWAAENNIIGGYGNGRFGPDDQITREQMAAILYRFTDFLGILPTGMDTVLNYPDAASISNYAKTAALYCQTFGIIGGRTGGIFAPQGTATRAEVATIIQRFVQLIVK
ncbi:MAG: S-layer homology domain-containing protein [Ruminiclostridium sp.]|nr:S-layer homology domain-containing protein [Ruminiclostridium sp.]